MINLKNILTEGKNPLYYDFQIRINPRGMEPDITFLHRDNKMQKHTTSVKDDPLILNYRNIPGLVKAAYKLYKAVKRVAKQKNWFTKFIAKTVK